MGGYRGGGVGQCGACGLGGGGAVVKSPACGVVILLVVGGGAEEGVDGMWVFRGGT